MNRTNSNRFNKRKYNKYKSQTTQRQSKGVGSSKPVDSSKPSETRKPVEAPEKNLMANPIPTTTAFSAYIPKKIDYVLVYSKKNMLNDDYKLSVMSKFIANMKLNGLEVEEEQGLMLDDLVCVKVHTPTNILNQYSEHYNMELTKNNPYYKFKQKVRWKCMRTLLTTPNIDDPLFQRASDTLSGNQPTDYTDAERIYITDKILSQIKYGNLLTDIGHEQLTSKKIFLAVYPLHDSHHEWTKDGPLSDRQLLARYWANLRYFYKEQPLNLLEKYYGSEIAFYFAWVGFYTKMLFPAAILGLICFAIGFLWYSAEGQYIEEEVCKSDQIICPVCPSDEWCSFEPLKNSCSMMKVAYVLENPITILYSVLMSFWGIIFMVLWKRKQAMLRLRWNLHDTIVQGDTRHAFIKAAPLNRVSSITGDLEYYFTLCQKVKTKVVSFFLILLMFSVYCLAVVLVMYYRLNILFYGRKSRNQTFKEYLSLFETMTSAFMSFMIMVFFDTFKRNLSVKLTLWENPRTQTEFDRQVAIKLSIFSFGNVFFPVVYLAFFKGRFYTHPGDQTQWTFFGMFKADVCKISGCLLDLSVQLATIMILKNGMRLFAEIMVPVTKVYLEHIKSLKSLQPVGAQWEEDFVLIDIQDNFLYSEYIQMALQYGFMTFFVVSLPIAPLLAFLNNIIEIRLDAIKILKNYRRPVPKKVTGIKEWNVMMQIITVLGTISNPLLIAYSSHLIPRYIYLFKNNNSMKGFINSTLSEFLVADYPGKVSLARFTPVTTCSYPGKRFPPSHPNKYEHNMDYWYQFAVKSIFFIILENVCLLLSLFLSYIITDIPRKVQIKLDYEQKILQQARIKKTKK